MDIADDRRRFLIVGSAALTTLATGSAYLWWGPTDVTRQPANGAIRIVPGTDRPPIVARPPAASQPVLADASPMPDRDTEARLNRLMEDDAANSRQRMRERQQQRSDAPPPTPAPSDDAASTTWAP